MPLQNRVDPFGIIHAVPQRGAFMGNRGGCFHTDDKALKRTQWASPIWITCVLSFKGRKRTLMSPRQYTELFFMDEITSLAAGHRPCYECRRQDALRFKDAIERAGIFESPPLAKDLSRAITPEVQNILRGKTERASVDPATLPDGAMFAVGRSAYLKWQGHAREWSFDGYGAAAPLPQTGVRLTPLATCAALANGYVPHVHDSARA